MESKLSAIPYVLWFVTATSGVTAKVVVGDRSIVRTISSLARTANAHSMLSRSIHLLPNDATIDSTSFHAPPAITAGHSIKLTVSARSQVHFRAAVCSQQRHTKPQLRSITRKTNGTNTIHRNNGMAEHQIMGTP